MSEDDVDDTNDVDECADQIDDAQDLALELGEDLPPRLMRMAGWTLIGLGHRADGNEQQAEAALLESTHEMIGYAEASTSQSIDRVDLDPLEDVGVTGDGEHPDE